MNEDLIYIVNLALWNRLFDERQLLPMSEDDWKRLYNTAQLQGLSAIFIDGLEKLSDQSSACRK